MVGSVSPPWQAFCGHRSGGMSWWMRAHSPFSTKRLSYAMVQS